MHPPPDLHPPDPPTAVMPTDPQFPGYSTSPPSRSAEPGSNQRYLLVGGIVLGAVVIGAAVALLVAGRGNDSNSTVVHNVTTVVRKTETATTSAAAPSQPSSSNGPIYARHSFVAHVPSTFGADAVDSLQGAGAPDAFYQNTWRSGSATIEIDSAVIENPTPADKLAQLRSQVQGTVDLGAVPAYLPIDSAALRWDFAYQRDRRVDFLLNACGRSVAMLGSAPASEFGSYRSTFSQVAQSLRPNC